MRKCGEWSSTTHPKDTYVRRYGRFVRRHGQMSAHADDCPPTRTLVRTGGQAIFRSLEWLRITT
jgi:hypothetical protein